MRVNSLQNDPERLTCVSAPSKTTSSGWHACQLPPKRPRAAADKPSTAARL